MRLPTRTLNEHRSEKDLFSRRMVFYCCCCPEKFKKKSLIFFVFVFIFYIDNLAAKSDSSRFLQ